MEEQEGFKDLTSMRVSALFMDITNRKPPITLETLGSLREQWRKNIQERIEQGLSVSGTDLVIAGLLSHFD